MSEQLSDRLQSAADGLDTAGDSSSSMWMQDFADDAKSLEAEVERLRARVEELEGVLTFACRALPGRSRRRDEPDAALARKGAGDGE